MKDLIERQAAIDALAKHEKSNGHNYTLFVDIVSECAEIIRDLPSAQPEQRWIPCSEKLPEDEQPILFSTTTGRVHQGRFHRDNSVNRWYSSLDKMRAYNNVVNAWMPLPEPYKEDDHD